MAYFRGYFNAYIFDVYIHFPCSFWAGNHPCQDISMNRFSKQLVYWYLRSFISSTLLYFVNIYYFTKIYKHLNGFQYIWQPDVYLWKTLCTLSIWVHICLTCHTFLMREIDMNVSKFIKILYWTHSWSWPSILNLTMKKSDKQFCSFSEIALHK